MKRTESSPCLPDYLCGLEEKDMIRFRDKVFENYFIDPETGIITDKDGVVQEVKEGRGYFWFKKMAVHRIQVHTHLGYRRDGWDVHHIDGNPHNNALENLQYLRHGEHARLTNKGRHFSEEHKKKISEARLGQTLTEETRKKLSEAQRGKNGYWLGKPRSEETKNKLREANLGEKSHWFGTHWWTNGKINKQSRECPGEGFVKGRM